jgi:AcrR family transcriptional regulator
VCRRAGVSQGALFKHFPSKADLLGATVRHLFTGLVEDFRAAFASAEAASDPVGHALALLRETFAQPRLLAAFELYAAARTDPGLAASLSPVLADHRENLRAEARKLFPRAGAGADFDALVDLVMAALQGAALGALVLPDPAAETRGLALLERLLRQEIGRV